ncbi:hypothetical protein EDD36DRAFT_420044 [Exophiala viscosa]|uniref:DNA/RNA-binding domain-containing protein n=1 Tax=Exophiala viscosa TaxID=2486360 RepID=A0AAN6DU61_9EURO|nr:hypothetical protein EDD36DRAFT_420044 [Exophiala viscosa]
MRAGSPPTPGSKSWWKTIPKRSNDIEPHGPGHPSTDQSPTKSKTLSRVETTDQQRQQRQEPGSDASAFDSSQQISLQAHPRVKQEPSHEQLVTQLKRPAHDPEVTWPNKVRSHDDRGSASPYSPRHEQALSHVPSPPIDSTRTPTPSAGFRSAQRTPLSSPKLSSPVPVTGARQHLRQSSHLLQEKSSFMSSPNPASIHPQDVPSGNETKMLLQPETRPISQEQLVNEVKGIYAGLVMVEKKCVEICQQQSQTTNKLSNEQWQALIALHRTLLHEHHDFFLASQHPTASPALRRLPTKYAMPARMWRHGIHSFLELLRHRLPHSLEHMLSFVYLAYQMMGLLMESVHAYHETWIECLGDLARYRMAIEEADMRDRENWSGVARMWYNKAADRSPTTGRIQHHLAVLARPNVVRQLFFYSKALVSGIPFVNARDSIMLLFSPFLDHYETTSQKYSRLEGSLVTAAGILFTRGSVYDYCRHIIDFITELDAYISRSGSNWKVQGPEVASSLVALLLDFGAEDNFLWRAYCNNSDTIRQIQTARSSDPSTDAVQVEDPTIKQEIQQRYWGNVPISTATQAAPATGGRFGANFVSSDEVTSYVLPVWGAAIGIVAGKIGDRNILPFMHFMLGFLWSLSYVPGALVYLEEYVPWAKLVKALNSISRSGVADATVESSNFPQQRSGLGLQLPEDFPMRGLKWSSGYVYPPDFFEREVVDEDERTLEIPSHAAPRAERCLWLGVRLASLKRYITYDFQTKQFACTAFALTLNNDALIHTLQLQPPAGPDQDAAMADVVP